MKNILIVDDELSFVASLKESLAHYFVDYNILTADNGKKAIQILKSTPVAIVLTDLRMPEMDGVEFLTYMNKNFPSIPAIVMSAYGTPKTKSRLKSIETVKFFDKPMDFQKLANAITDGIENFFKSGSLKSISINNFLQIIEMEQKTCFLEVNSGGKKNGFFYFNKGILYDAVCGNLEGEDAALEMISWGNVNIKINYLPKNKATRRINAELVALIIEGIKKKDESTEANEKGDLYELSDIEKPETGEEERRLMAQAIRLAEGHHFREAQKLLNRVLKINSRNLEAWLWYSRVTDDITTIHRCLLNAEKIASTDPDVIGEIEKFYLLRDKNVGNEKLRRCPFCWFLLETKSPDCPYCNAFLRTNSTFLTYPKLANKELLEKAIERYKRVLSHETHSLIAYYYMGLAHLNFEHWEEGINCLSKAVDLSPKNSFLSKQLNYVLQYLASVSKKETGADLLKSQPTHRKNAILVVEDSPTTRKVISTTLTQKGYRVMEAGDGLEALSKLSDEIPDLILLDIILPKMDGYQILDIIKKRSELKNIPVIMLTAKDRFVDKLKGKMAGSSKYLTKPFEPDQLLKVVSKYLQ